MVARRLALLALLFVATSATPWPQAVSQQVSGSVAPGSGNSYVPGPIGVTVTWCAVGAALDNTTQSISFNGQDVTASFTWAPGTQPGCDSYAVSSGSVTLGLGA